MTDLVETATIVHESILASAGAGKTYQLTRRYIQLLAAGVEPPAILASSFTRAAAGEIRDRILGRLAESVVDDAKRRELGEDIGRPDLTANEVLALLERVARSLHRLQVRTLDSFFFSIVNAFALELGIPPGAAPIEDDAERRLRRRAIGAVLDDVPGDQLVELLRSLTQGASDKEVNRAIEEVVDELHAVWLEAPAEAWERLQPPPLLPAAALGAAIDAIEAADIPAHKTFAKGRAANVGAAREERWEDFIAGGVARAIIAGSAAYCRKPLEADLVDRYRPVIDHATGVLLGRVARQNIATRDFLAMYDERLRRLRHRERAISYADVTAACAGAAASGHLDEIRYRIDARIGHMLLDEMQDTSILQWAALRPFAEEMTSYRPPERSFFCVGDVKQSIYGWRGAVPEILQSMPDLLGGGIQVRPLSKSWRSSPVVIEAVNRVFERLDANPALAERPGVTSRWSEMFDRHETERTDLAGHVRLVTAPAPRDGETKKLARLRAAARIVGELHAAAPRREIGVLTRSNAGVARLIFELSELGLVASERGGMPLTNAPPVAAILDLLLLADHPDDTVAAFNVARGPLGPVVGLASHADAPRRRALAAEVRRRLLADGYAETIAAWTRAIAPACSERDLGRLLQLVDEAGRYDARSTLRPDDFVTLVEGKPIADATPSPIQVMTIHQSKGLEFDSVVLAELDDQLGGTRSDKVMVDRDGAAGVVTTVCRWLNESLRPLAPQFEAIAARQKDRRMLEGLCTLYVAMTRARQGLVMVIDPPKVKKNGELSTPKSAAAVVRAALAPDGAEPGTCLDETGDPGWIRDDRPTPLSAPVAPAPVAPLRSAPGPGDAAAGRAPSAAAHAPDATLAELLQPPDADAIDRGTAIHALFEQVEWIDDLAVDRAGLAAIARSVLPRRDAAWAAARADEFLGMLEHPAVRAALSRATHGVGATVHRERPYARIDQDALVRGTIDRLVVERSADGPSRATIIDFKTDDVTAATADARAERYRAQLDAYREATSEQLGLDPDRIERVLAFCTPGIVVRGKW